MEYFARSNRLEPRYFHVAPRGYTLHAQDVSMQ